MEAHEIDDDKAGCITDEEIEELLDYIVVNKACYRMGKSGPYVYLGPIPSEVGQKLKRAFGGVYRSDGVRLYPVTDNFYRVYGTEAQDLIRLLLPKLMRKDPYRYSFAVTLV